VSEGLGSRLQKVGTDRITHHDRRHLFATGCIESGVDIPTVSRWLGHKDGCALAMKTYGHLRREHSIAQAQKVSFAPLATKQVDVIIPGDGVAAGDLQSRKLACSVISTATAGDICCALRVPGLSRQKSMGYQNRSIPFTVKTAKKLKLREPHVITVAGKAFYDIGPRASGSFKPMKQA
jgi:hypothetical protein